MNDSPTIALNVVESTCVVDCYTVVDTPRTPVHNTPVFAALGTRQFDSKGDTTYTLSARLVEHLFGS